MTAPHGSGESLPAHKAEPSFGPNTKTTLGVVVTVLVVLLGAFGYMESFKASIIQRLDKQGYRMQRMEEKDAAYAKNSWTKTDMELWAERLARANPDLKLPKETP